METDEKAATGAGGPAADPAVRQAIDELNRLTERLDAIISRLESGEPDLGEATGLLEEANQAAAASSRCLEQAIQGVVYGEPADDADGGQDGSR